MLRHDSQWLVFMVSVGVLNLACGLVSIHGALGCAHSLGRLGATELEGASDAATH